MQFNFFSKLSLLTVVLIGLVFFLALIFYLNLKSPIQNNLVLSGEQERANLGLFASSAGRPARIKIPGINVDSAVEYVGFDSSGAMDVPKSPANVAWFEFGPRPGENGSAVIAGHYGWKNGTPAVFDDLYKLRKGDKLYIENNKGEIISFVVRESRRYDPEADASDVFGSNDGKAHLNLITCEGVWNKDQKSYSKRLVVFADKEE